jgi:hypothetical protein
MVTAYRGKWRRLPVHNVYWSNSNFRTATCIMTIIHSRTDKNYRACFCSKLTAIRTKWHTRLSTKLLYHPFRLTRILITFICSFSASVLYCLIQFPFFRISTSIHWIKLFLSFLFRRPDFWLTSLIFVILFALTIIALSHPLLWVSSFCAQNKSHWFSFFLCSLKYIVSNKNTGCRTYSKI